MRRNERTQRMLSLLAALCLLPAALCLLPAAGLAAENGYLTITELREQTPARWQQTIETKWRTIEVDAEIRIPEVDRVPVALVGGGIGTPALSAVESGWQEIAQDSFHLSLYNGWEDGYPKKLNGKRLNKDLETKEVWHSGYSAQAKYVPLSDIAFGEICDRIEAEISRFGYDPAEFDVRTPTELRAGHMYLYGYKRDALPGGLRLTFRCKVLGLPLLGHVSDAVDDGSDGMRADEYRLSPDCSATYNAYSGQFNYLYLRRVQPVEVLAQDVPLCGLEKVLSAVEQEIKAGRIRKVYEVELGYLLYNQPGVYHSRKTAMVEGRDSAEAMARDDEIRRQENDAAQFYLKPVWQVNCLWVSGPRAKLRETASYTTDERNSLDYYEFCFDAQTGETLKKSGAQDRAEFKGFLSWEDVR